jgi:hypothetical protein
LLRAAPGFAANPRLNDYLWFLAGRDRYYLDYMKASVSAALDPTVPVAGAQMGYGGLLNIDSHAGLDYQDTLSQPRKRVEMSLDTAGRGARATSSNRDTCGIRVTACGINAEKSRSACD